MESTAKEKNHGSWNDDNTVLLPSFHTRECDSKGTSRRGQLEHPRVVAKLWQFSFSRCRGSTAWPACGALAQSPPSDST